MGEKGSKVVKIILLDGGIDMALKGKGGGGVSATMLRASRPQQETCSSTYGGKWKGEARERARTADWDGMATCGPSRSGGRSRRGLFLPTNQGLTERTKKRKRRRSLCSVDGHKWGEFVK